LVEGVQGRVMERNKQMVDSELRQKPDETLDSIRDIRLFQSKRGYRFSVDALLLEEFIPSARFKKAIELGTGSGIISILLSKRLKEAKIIAVEIQPSLAEKAERNVRLNKLNEKIEILNKDLKELKDIFPPNSFDLAFSNPPFRKTKTGLLSVDDERSIARHEIKMRLDELIDIASYLLKNTGRFFLIYHPFRLAELISLLRQRRLEPKRMRFVHSREGEEAKMVLIEVSKGAGIWLRIDPPLYVYKKGREYTDEMKRIYGHL
jgi:tRNA1Val (adenine37-N6)-methyltransferase